MSNLTAAFAAFQAVKVIDAEYERHGQVGVFVGPSAEGESSVKFEGENPSDPQVIDTFPNAALQGL